MAATDPDRPPAPLDRTKGNRAYLYRQLAARIRAELTNGIYQPGERLPSMDELAGRFNVSKVTVIKALGELRNEGHIHSIPAQGTYVSEPAPSVPPATGGLAIGLVSHALKPGTFGPYHSEVIAGINDRISRTDAHLALFPAGRIDPQDKILDLVTQARLQAAIYLGPIAPPVLKRLVDNGPPAMLIDLKQRGLSADAILIDNREGGRLAIEHLLSLGHRRIAFITGPPHDPTAQQRSRGAHEAGAQSGIDTRRLPTYNGRWEREGGFEAARTWLDAGAAPTALCCQNDEMAVGAMQAIQAHSRLAIPEDISVVGFDDISWAAATHPPLTTVRVDKALIGRLGVDHLLARLADPDRTPITTVVSTRLVIRETTRPPRQA